MKPLISVVIPAYNEEKYIGKCLESVKRAAAQIVPLMVQIIVVANRCTDRTAEIAAMYDAEVVESEATCIAAVRNEGAARAEGQYLVTIDADSCMDEEALMEVCTLLHGKEYIGGGAIPVFDRASLGIAVSSLVVAAEIMKRGEVLSGAMFWTYTKAFRAIGGFDENLVSLEDRDFAKRLKAFGERYGRKYGTLECKLVTSARKFDQFGDWYLLKNYKMTKAIFTGTDREAADAFYYKTR